MSSFILSVDIERGLYQYNICTGCSEVLAFYRQGDHKIFNEIEYRMLPILMFEDVFAFWDLLILLDYLRKQSYILQIYTRLSLTFSNTLKGNYQKRKNPKNLWLMTKVQNRPVRRKVVPLVLALKLWHQLNLKKWVRAFTTVTTVTLCEEHSQAGNTMSDSSPVTLSRSWSQDKFIP